MSFPKALLGLAALAAISPAAGCGTSGDATPAATTRVTMAKSYRFEPRAIAVPVGATVIWTNDDNFTHSVQVDGQEDHTVGPGERVSIAFPTAGTYHYVCRLHRRDMNGEVVVS
jgi:plastocyanin